MARIVLYLNQFFGQIGGEDMAGVGPRFTTEVVGPGRALIGLLEPGEGLYLYTDGVTEAVNLVAQTFARSRQGDEIVVTALEHHSNLVPWQRLGVKVRIADIDDRGELRLGGDRLRARLCAPSDRPPGRRGL